MLNINIKELAKSINDNNITEEKESINKDIAIIGISVKLPMAQNINDFWDNLKAGRDCVTDLPRGRKAEADAYFKFKGKDTTKIKYKKGSYLERLDEFDSTFFKISPREASLMDPNQRMFLEIAWSAVEDAGYGGDKLKGSRTGVYCGFVSDLAYQRFIGEIEPSSLGMSIPGNMAAIIPGRVSYTLDLKGPSILVDTACSSSLTAVHTACCAMRNGDCDMAIAGSIKMSLLPLEDENMLGIESKNYTCKAFDDDSDGTCMGEGVMAVVLKPLAKALKDKDNVYAVIKGSAINQDGNSIGITAPNVLAQAEVFENAWRDADIAPDTITYIEAHGTGTKLGDPIEIEGMSRAFSKYTDRKQFCAVGAVKTNLGHLDSAAGMAGLIKAILALKKKQIPPSIHFNKPNRNIDFRNTPLFINDRLLAWESDGSPRRCGVSAFGLSGTNCHIILEEAPPVNYSKTMNDDSLQIFTLSTKNMEGLNHLIKDYLCLIEKGIEATLRDLCYTANTGRGHYGCRLAIVTNSLDDLKVKLMALTKDQIRTNEEKSIYYGEFKVGVNIKNEQLISCLSESEQKRISDIANKKINDLKDKMENLTVWGELCSLYTKGANVYWDELYDSGNYRHVSLPAYPFEKRRCWIDIPQFAGRDEEQISVSDASIVVYERQRKSIINDIITKLEGYIDNTKDKMVMTSIDLLEFEKYGFLLLLKSFHGMNVFKNEGESYPKDELKKKIGVIEKYDRLFEALIDILERGGYLAIADNRVLTTGMVNSREAGENVENISVFRERLLTDNPDLLHYVKLLDTCMVNLKNILTGATPASNVLFPNASSELVEGIYKDDKNGVYCNMLAAFCIKTHVELRLEELKDETIYILEVGAGTGGTTRWVLENLIGYEKKVEYYYTDISPTLVENARETFGKDYSFVRFKKFDLEKEAEKQGFERNKFDLVLGANVVHATRNIRNVVGIIKKLLKTNGLFVLIEGATVQDFSTLTFGMLDGWWLYEDSEIRLEHSPMLSIESWRSVLSKMGFANQFVFDNELNFQTLMIAESDGVIKEHSDSVKYINDKYETKKRNETGGKEVLLKGKESGPYTELEKQIAGVWGEILGFNEIGLDDSFYELGGDSIIAMKIVNALNIKLNKEIKVADLMEFPNIRELAAFMDKRHIKESPEGISLPSIVPLETQKYYSLSSAQKRIFLVEQLSDTGVSYNIPIAVMMQGEIDKERFEEIFSKLIVRHEALRTSFEFINNEPVQIIHHEFEFNIEYIETSEHELRDVVNSLVRPFDLKKAPLFRVSLVKIAPNKHILFYDLHHIISDGISQLILLREFKQLYQSQELPKLDVQYKDYAVWHNGLFDTEMMKKQEKYWLDKFAGEIPVLNMPLDYKRPDIQRFTGGAIEFSIPEEVVAKLKELGKKQGITLNSVLLSLYAMLLFKYSNQQEVVIGSLVAGRMHQALENIIGVFINFIPIKFKANYDSTITEYLSAIGSLILEAYENQDYPFEKIVEKVTAKLDRTRNPLFDTVFIFHNESEMNDDNIDIEGLAFSRYELNLTASKLDFKIDAQVNKAGELVCVLEYNTGLFNEDTMRSFAGHFNLLLEKVIDEPGQKIADLVLFTNQEKSSLEEKRKLNRKTENGIPLAVSATFTSEPIEDYIVWWCRQFNINIDMRFAPYNQVFQALLNPESLLSGNTGLNMLMVRFEDWIRNDHSDENEQYLKLEENFENFSGIIKGWQSKNACPCFIGIFPVSTHLSLSKSMISYLENMNKRWKNVLKDYENVHIIDFTNLDKLYGIHEVFDPRKDKEGHLPFSDEYYAAMGTFIARKICASQRRQFKVIVLDCDNTLWQGICGEDGELGITIDKNYTALQKFMLDKYRSGMLLAICSKNNEQDVWNVFEKNPQMTLKKEHIVSWRINWQSKAENIKSLAQELNLGLDSFIFIDDSPVECCQVMEECPAVLTAQLPHIPGRIPAFLEHIWAFDIFKVTEEDKNRTEMYVTEKKRQEIQEQKLSLADFIKSLELKMSINLMHKSQLGRVAQLTQRTNQFNLSTIRRTEEEITLLLSNPGVKCWVVEVEDRFGDYGLVGVVITREEARDALFLDTFLLSCRVLGRGVENAILANIGRYCREVGGAYLEAKFYPTPKNRPFLEFLESAGWDTVEKASDCVIYRLAVDKVADHDNNITCFYKSGYIKEKPASENKVKSYSLDHIAMAVPEIEKARERYLKEGFQCGQIVHDPLQNAYLSMCARDGYDALELVAPVNNDSPVYRLLGENTGEIPYHLCYRVENCERFLAELNTQGIEYELISDAKEAVLFDNNKVTFIRVKNLGLIELLECKEDSLKDSDNKIKSTVLQIVVIDPGEPVTFFKHMGYIQEKSSLDVARKMHIITFFKPGAGKIEIIVPTDKDTQEYKFFLKNGAHPYRLYFESEADEQVQFEENTWEVRLANTENLLYKNYLLPLANHSGQALLKLPVYQIFNKNVNRAEYKAPTNETEERLAIIWQEILGLEKIGINDNFFELGGHSLKATALVSRISREFNVELSLTDAFKLPTIKMMAKHITGSELKVYRQIEPAAEKEYYSLSSAQKRLYLLSHMEGIGIAYNQPVAMVIDGALDREKLEATFKKLIKRHEALRTSFTFANDEPVQKIDRDPEFKINYLKTGEDPTNAGMLEMLKDFIKPFDLNKAPLLRVGLIEVSKTRHIMVCDMHHIISDGASMVILIKEFVGLYTRGALPDLRIQYKDFSAWQNQLFQSDTIKKQEKYWLDRFSGTIPVLNMPTDYPRPSIQSFEGDTLSFEAGSEIVTGISRIVKENGTTFYIVLLAVYNILLAKYSGQEDIIVGSPITGRPHADLENIIGMFVNTLAMRNYPDGHKTFIEFLREVKVNSLLAYENQDYQLEELVDKLEIPRSLSRNPLFDTVFVSFKFDIPRMEIEGLKFMPYPLPNGIAKFDLTLQAEEDEQKINFGFEYSTRLFTKETITRMGKDYIRILEAIIADQDIKINKIKLGEGYTKRKKVITEEIEFDF